MGRRARSGRLQTTAICMLFILNDKKGGAVGAEILVLKTTGVGGGSHAEVKNENGCFLSQQLRYY
jgi:hypothetical protein